VEKKVALSKRSQARRRHMDPKNRIRFLRRL
jgi:hypothetical protein